MMTRQSWCFNDFNLSWITTISGLPPAGFRPPAPHSRPSSLTIHRVSQTMYNSHKIQVLNTNTENLRKCQRKCVLLPAFQENTKCAWKRKIWGSVLLPSNVSESRVSRKLGVSRNLGSNSRALCAAVLCCSVCTVLCAVFCALCNCATVHCAADIVVVLKKKAQLVLYFYISYTVEVFHVFVFKKILWGSVRPFALLACFFPDRI